MFKLVAVACLALAFATQAASQNVIQKAQKAEQDKAQQQQKKAQEQQADAKKGAEAPHMKKAKANCNAKADGKKLKGDARKRYMDDCVKV